MSESKFSQAIAQEIFDQLVEGKSLAEICRHKSMPSYRAVWHRITVDKDFAEDYRRARIAQADADADAISDMAAQVRRGELDPAAARAAMDGYKWTSGRRNPKVYGDKLSLDGDIGFTVNIAGDDAKL